jgi:hypothetical protein
MPAMIIFGPLVKSVADELDGWVAKATPGREFGEALSWSR